MITTENLIYTELMDPYRDYNHAFSKLGEAGGKERWEEAATELGYAVARFLAYALSHGLHAEGITRAELEEEGTFKAQTMVTEQNEALYKEAGLDPVDYQRKQLRYKAIKVGVTRWKEDLRTTSGPFGRETLLRLVEVRTPPRRAL